eukprot:Rmarinus@m.7573
MDIDGGDDDPVVKEIDVYLNKNLVDELYVWQTPLRSALQKYDQSKLTACRVKPKQMNVELDFAMNPACVNQDETAAELEEDPKYTLQSSRVILKTNYAVGVLRGDDLHLTPLENMLQFRPSFRRFDEKAKVEKVGEDKNAGSGAPDLVAVQIRRRETERAAERRKTSHSYLLQKAEQESFQNFHFHGYMTAGSEDKFEDLVVTGDRLEESPSAPAEDYYNSLFPVVKEREVTTHAEAAAAPPTAVSVPAIGPPRGTSGGGGGAVAGGGLMPDAGATFIVPSMDPAAVSVSRRGSRRGRRRGA